MKYRNRGLEKAHTINELKKIMNEDSWEALVERLQQTMRSTYVPANTHIFNPNDPSYANSVGIIFLRHGEVKQWLICHE